MSAACAVAAVPGVVLSILGRREDFGKRGVPDSDDAEDLAAFGGIGDFQMECADELENRGLNLKARRRRLCARVGSRWRCSDTSCARIYYTPFGCRVRYCPECGPRMFRILHRKYAGLEQVARRLRREHRGYVLAKLDMMAVSLRRMPTAKEVRQFKKAIGKFVERICKGLRVRKKDVGVLYTLEFGGKNSNLHAHAIYCGPKLPKPRDAGKQGVLSRWWQSACDGTVFSGSFIVSVKFASNFQAALGHSLKYPAKLLSSSTPERLADLEAAFHGVRRVCTLGAFFNALPKDSAKEEGEGPQCPYCRAALRREGAWWPIPILLEQGYVDLEEARSAVACEKRAWAAAAPSRGSPLVGRLDVQGAWIQ